MITITSTRLSGKITLTPCIRASDDGSYDWRIIRDGWCSGNPAGGGPTVSTASLDVPRGEAASCHEAEIACAAALAETARAVRKLVAEAEVRLTDRETANQAAAAATARLEAIELV